MEKLVKLFLAALFLSLAAQAQITPDSSGHGAPSFNCHVNDTYKDNDNGLVWRCDTPGNNWKPNPQYDPWSTPTLGSCKVGNGNTWVSGACGGQAPNVTETLSGVGDGTFAGMPEKGNSITGGNAFVAWDDDFSGGIYDPRDQKWGSQATPLLQTQAFQKMENQIACDLSMGVVAYARAKIPQGTFYVDTLLIAPGSTIEGVPTSQGGTRLRSLYNNHPLMQAPNSMTLTCSDSNSHTDNLPQTRVDHLALVGCSTGGCVNAPGDTANYLNGGPSNTGLEMSSTGGVVTWTYGQAFGGYGIRVDGQDAKSFHDTLYGNDAWYYFGGYKGSGESAASPETNVTTTGTTSSVTLNWTAVASATGYVVYRGTSAGNESVFYITGTNSFIDTGAANTTGSVTNVVNTTVATPGTITPTGSTTGGTLAAGTYYYKVTALGADSLSLSGGWHGSIEYSGSDVMADWIEVYGLQDAPTVFTYHHIADILAGGGYSHFDHLWPQQGQVGVVEPLNYSIGDVFENIRIDFAKLEGFWAASGRLRIMGGNIISSCLATNAVTLNTGQDGTTPAGICNQFFSVEGSVSLSDVTFSYVAGFGSTQETADIYLGGTSSTYHNILGGNPLFQYVSGQGIVSGSNFEPATPVWTSITGPTPDMAGLYKVYSTESSPVTYTGFQNLQAAQDFYVFGGNANVTIQNNAKIVTCSGKDINLGNVTATLHFVVTSESPTTHISTVGEVCNSQPTPAIVASSETVAFSATPTFSIATRASIITLTGNVTGFTLAAGANGQEKTLTFCQDGTGSRTVTGVPANVHGFFTVGATLSKCSSQHFTYSAGQTAWLADSAGVTNE